MQPVTLAVAGAGIRGQIYAAWAAAHPDLARVVAVAEPDPERRAAFAREHGLSGAAVVDDWRRLADARVADAVIVATQDDDHVEPAKALLAAGYDVLLEKPMAPTRAECEDIVAAAKASGRIFGVCHVLRFTPLTVLLRDLLAQGAVGELQSVQHLEPVGWWHYAHSYVRGNWAREEDSSFMLLAKSCHDIDWLGYVIGRPLERAASFGSLAYFTPEHRPAEAADRCLDCPLRDTCAYSATRIYLDTVRSGYTGWPVSVLTPDVTPAGVERALREGPYGRCAWACDNTVVDRQVVALEYAGGVTATFQMMPFTDMTLRRTQLFGSTGELTTDGQTVEVFDFRTQQRTTHRAGSPDDPELDDGHGGGDAGLMRAFVAAVAAQDQSLLSTGADATLASHVAVFEIERARREGRVVELGGGAAR